MVGVGWPSTMAGRARLSTMVGVGWPSTMVGGRWRLAEHHGQLVGEALLQGSQALRELSWKRGSLFCLTVK